METSTKCGNETVEQRLEKLEKANRRLTWIALAFGAGFILLFALAATKPAPDTLRVKKLEVVDDTGKTRMALDVGWRKSAEIVMTDQKGIRRATIDESAIVFFDEHHSERAGLLLLDKGPILELSGESGHGFATFESFADGPSLLLFGSNKDYARLAIQMLNDEPYVRLFDKDLKTVAWQAPPK